MQQYRVAREDTQLCWRRSKHASCRPDALTRVRLRLSELGCAHRGQPRSHELRGQLL